jgi:hypothetical protein
MVLAANQTGLFKSYNLRQEFPNEWYRLKQSNTANLTIGLEDLPFFIQGHTPAVDTVMWLGRIKNNPMTFGMSLNGVGFNLNRDPALNNLCKGSSNPITLGTAFTLAASSTADLEDLALLVRYRLSN